MSKNVSNNYPQNQRNLLTINKNVSNKIEQKLDIEPSGY